MRAEILFSALAKRNACEYNKIMAKLSAREKELFETKPVMRSILILAAPTVIGQLITIAYNLSDTWFIAQTNDTLQVAAVTLVLPLYLMLTVLANLFGVGSGSMIASSLGVEKYEEVKKLSSFAFWITIIVTGLYSLILLFFRDPILFLLGAKEEDILRFASDYVLWTMVIGGIPSVLNVVMAHLVRATGKSLHASVGMTIGALLNIILDPIFIFPFGFGLGCKGAAIATFISNFVAVCYFFVYLIVTRKEGVLSLHPKHFTLRSALAGKAVVIGLPNAAMTFCATFSNVVLNLLVAGYGTSAVAALGIVKKIDLVPAHISQGLAQGVLPLLSYNFSAQNRERVNKAIRYAIIITVSLGAVFFAFYEIFAHQLMNFFIDDTETVEIGTKFIRLHCMAMPLLSILFLYVAIFQSKEKSGRAILVSLFRKGSLDIPLMIAMNAAWPLYGVMLVQPILDFASVILVFLLYYVIPSKGKKLFRT